MMLATLNYSNTKLYETMYNWRGEPRTYVAYIRGQRCTSHMNLQAEVSAALQFPVYYGENLDALSECLEDLEWLNADNIYIVIDQAEHFLQFDHAAGNIYCKILERATDYWKEQAQTFRVFLNLSITKK